MSRMRYFIKQISSIFVISICVLSASAVADPQKQLASLTKGEDLAKLAEGQHYFNQGDYHTAVTLWRNLADQGEPEAQVFVGLAYANGWGVKKNLDEATAWYMKAAEKNNSSGQFLLGLHYVTHSVNKYDLRVGIKWLKRAAANGDKGAIRFLKKAEKRNWFELLKNGQSLKRDELETEGRSILETISVTANELPKLPAPRM